MVKHISDRELEYLKDGDFRLLQINYDKAIKKENPTLKYTALALKVAQILKNISANLLFKII